MIFYAEIQPDELPPDCGHAQHYPPAALRKILGQHSWKCPGCGAVLTFVVYAKAPE